MAGQAQPQGLDQETKIVSFVRKDPEGIQKSGEFRVALQQVAVR